MDRRPVRKLKAPSILICVRDSQTLGAVFFHEPQAPINCDQPRLKIRMSLNRFNGAASQCASDLGTGNAARARWSENRTQSVSDLTAEWGFFRPAIGKPAQSVSGGCDIPIRVPLRSASSPVGWVNIAAQVVQVIHCRHKSDSQDGRDCLAMVIGYPRPKRMIGRNPTSVRRRSKQHLQFAEVPIAQLVELSLCVPFEFLPVNHLIDFIS